MFIHLFQVGDVFDINVISHKNPTEYKILECPNITIISTLNMNIKMFMCHNKMFRTMKDISYYDYKTRLSQLFCAFFPFFITYIITLNYVR